ncbi:SPOC domain-containing protein [Triangularia setosa]|uniref:SPOC domain-containing protein n=1 Tax=Triangularia setosa TaxID=2587417 RepID=A0AAN7A9J8_9PEZI|nr:SPOC domain-containing protein [Podospora setosa]
MSDPEPRRSVRATKGQHKAHEQLDQLVEPPKKRTGGSKKGKKAAPEPEEPEEEIIRCVCGATEQDEDSGEAWIACDTCTAWQHNICMGVSQFAEDIPKNYFCEQCKPENHKELLASMARGEKLWETRRKNYEEEKSKKKKGSKKGKKRTSDLKEEASRTPQQSPPPPPPPPAPEPKKEKEPKASGQKRKTVDGAQEKETKKLRKVTETQSVPVSTPAYTPPADLPSRAAELPDSRQGSLVHSLGAAVKQGIVPSDGVFALQIERAETYRNQGRTLVHNLKSNLELGTRLLEEELASKELQDQTAEMKARAEKQAIKITEDVPRIRRTHKGDEMIGDDNYAITTEDIPSAPSEPRESSEASRARSASRGLPVDTQQSPSRADFDLNKVYSSVKSPAVSQRSALPLAAAPAAGPGVDLDVDRMLDDDGSQSPPYSPKEETDPDVVWRGSLVMNTIAEFQVTAKHIGGANPGESVGLTWDKVIPKNITVCGRIDEQAANVYLCGMRYSQVSEVIVVNLEPTSPQGKAGMQKLVEYFVNKKRYGVVDRKGLANVRDSYLVPVLPGAGGHPEFMMNLEDNFIPQSRTEPMMLAVFVYRWEDGKVPPKAPQAVAQASARHDHAQSPNTPTPASAGFPLANRQSSSAPAYSPTVNSGSFPNYPAPPRNSATPLQQQQQVLVPPPQAQEPAPTPEQARRVEAQRRGEAEAREVLGQYMRSPTVAFLLPQAYAMTRSEWELIRRVYEREPKAREDLPYLSQVLEREAPGPQNQPSGPSPPPPPPPLLQPQQQRPQQYQAPLQQHQQQHFHPPPQQHQPQYPHPQQAQQQHPQHQQQGAQRSPIQQQQPQPQQQQQQSQAVPVRQTAVPPPQIPPVGHVAGPPRQTPIPPPPIPPQATATTAGSQP